MSLNPPQSEAIARLTVAIHELNKAIKEGDTLRQKCGLKHPLHNVSEDLCANSDYQLNEYILRGMDRLTNLASDRALTLIRLHKGMVEVAP